MTRSHEGLLRRLGRALKGVQAIEYGRPVPSEPDDTSPPPAPEIVVEPPRRSHDQRPDAEN